MTGSGTSGDPYIIGDVTDLQAMNDHLDDTGVYFELGGAIDASATSEWNSGAGFVPIGNQSHTFKGHLDGKGYAISDLYIYRPNTDCVGFIGFGVGCDIDNVRLHTVNITGDRNVGGFFGYCVQSQTNCCCVMGGSVHGNHITGGFGGSLTSISYCWTAGVHVYGGDKEVSGDPHFVGGFAGYIGSSAINDCYARNTVHAGEYNFACGLYSGGTIGGATKCYSACTLTGETEDLYGQSCKLGQSTDDVSDTYWDITIWIYDERPPYYGCETSGEKTTTQMKTQSTYEGWDFDTIWAIDPAYNDGYPYLQCLAPACNLAVTTLPATDITASSAILHGEVATDCGEGCVCSFEWGEVEGALTDWYSDDLLYDTGEQFATTDDELPDSPTGLKAATTYYFRTRATNSWGVTYGATLSFTTLGEVYPSEATTRVTALIHRWFPGTFTLEMNLGAVSSQFGLPSWEEEPPPSIPPEEPSPAPVAPPDVPEWAEPFFPICISGTVMCFGRDLYKCVAGRWELQQRNSPACAGAIGATCVDGTYKIEGEVVYKCIGGQWVAQGRF